MLWDPASTKKDGEGEGDSSAVTPILVPLQNKQTGTEKSVPLLVPAVQDLKDQFQQQQNMLTQIKETLKQNESQLNSKEKQVEVYANKLSQIRARSKNTQGKKAIPSSTSTASSVPAKTLVKKSSKENLEVSESIIEQDKPPGNIAKVGRRGKISELKKCIEENKIKFEQRTGKEQTETKIIESMVEQLKTKLDESDKTIQDLQKHIEQPTHLPKTKQKLDKESVASKFTQTNQTQTPDESAKIIALQNKIYELETNVLDLQENLKEKESVIEARTQAVTLLSQDLSLKGKNTLENLEETRQEMRAMQNNFIAIENQLKNDVSERDNRLIDFEEKYANLQSKNAELQEKFVKLQERYAEMEMEKNSLGQPPTSQSQKSNDKVEELQKKVTVLTKEVDDRNKTMIKMKIEHKNKLKNLNKTIETLKMTSNEKAEIVRLSKMVEDYESVKIGLENRVAELEDEKASDKKLKDQINELEIIIQKQNEDLAVHVCRISDLEKEKADLIQASQDQNVVIENLYAKTLNVGSGVGDAEGKDGSQLKELSRKLENMEAEYNRRLEELKTEHGKEIEMLESYYNSKMLNSERRELEEYRISTEMNNIHVEEQIELLIREKQQLLEKLKNITGVSSTDSIAFEKVERSDLGDEKTVIPRGGEEVDSILREDTPSYLQLIVNDQQNVIDELQRTIQEEKQKAKTYENKIREMEGTIKELEDSNALFKEQIKSADGAESGKKSSFNAKNKVKKIEMELAETKKAVEEQAKKMQDLNQKLEEKDELIKKYTEKIELFEKDDWDRQNHWQNAEDDFDNVQELQKKCLSLENSLIELTEHCERLRKENIEVVHLLSEEKVKRKKLLEEFGSKSVDVEESSAFREKVNSLNELVTCLDTKVEKLEVTLSNSPTREKVDPIAGFEEEFWGMEELQQKLEWTNVVLTSKETEIFRLQNLLEDRSKMLEDLEANLNESKAKLTENEKILHDLSATLKLRETQILEMSTKLQETVKSETQMEQLMGVLKQMEAEMLRKDSQIQELEDALTQKNNDVIQLKNHMEGMNDDLAKNYQEQLDKIGKCLQEKELELTALVADKNNLASAMNNLIEEQRQNENQVLEMTAEKGKLQEGLLEKDKLIMELTEKLVNMEKSTAADKTPVQDIEDLKIKMKKLAANLKKKAQNEADLLKQVKDLEVCIADKDKMVSKLQADINDVTEKWTLEKSEKEQFQNELTVALSQKSSLENESANLKTKYLNLEMEFENSAIFHEGQLRYLQEEIQRTSRTCNDFHVIEQQYKDKIEDLDQRVTELSASYQSAVSRAQESEAAVEEGRKAREESLKKLAEVTGKFEEMKFKHDQVLLAKADIENKLEDLHRSRDNSVADKSRFDAKLQENLAVIENLEAELVKAQDQVKVAEEKLFLSEERRLSLENKNEEMCRKITEDSESLTTIDDLAHRVDELLKSEKRLVASVRALEANNAELKQAVEEERSGKQSLDVEVKGMSEKMSEMTNELKRLKDVDADKNNTINSLTKEMEKTKADNTRIQAEFDKLNRDYEQFEVDFKENLENSQNTEKSLRHRIEELTNENALLVDKVNYLADDRARTTEKSDQGDEEEKKPRKKKSVTFRTDEVEYIKDLKKQLHSYDASLKEANEEIDKLRGELLRETLKTEVSNVVAEAEEKAENLKSVSHEEMLSPVSEVSVSKTEVKGLSAARPDVEERKFDANLFFGASQVSSGEVNSFFDGSLKMSPEEAQQGGDFDSLVWDDGWGTDGQLEEEYMQTKMVEDGPKTTAEHHDEKIKSLEAEIDVMRGEVDKLTKELQEQTAKYTKALKKLKEQKVNCEKLQSEVSRLRTSDGFGDLNAAIVDELKLQIENMEKKEKEYLKNLENHKAEKESLLRKIDVLNVGNEKFLEMKERKDNDAEIWQEKNNELLKEISILRQQLEEPRVPDDNALMKENRELINKVEALEWKNCELTQQLDEKDELLEARPTPMTAETENVTADKSLLQKEIEELKNVKALLERKLLDEESKNATTVEQLSALAAENETLQDILGEMKSKEPPKIDPKLADLNQKVTELENLLKVKDGEIAEMRAFISQLDAELTEKRQILTQVQSEKEFDGNRYRESLAEAEGMLRQREKELQLLREQFKAKEEELAKEKILAMENQGQPISLEISKFDAIDLNQVQGLTAPPVNTEVLERRIQDLENQLRSKEELLKMQSFFAEESSRQMDQLKERNIRLEDVEFARFKADEMNQFKSTTWTQEGIHDGDDLRKKIKDLEEILRFKENQLYQMETEKANEIQGLNVRLYEMENALQTADAHQTKDLQQRIYELEALVRLSEEKSQTILIEKTNEIESLAKKVQDLEGLLSCKTDEANQLLSKLGELEKSYNDSKIEIERLLNEEKLNSEEKFVEPFQNNIQIPVAFELEAMTRSLEEEKQKAENLQFELVDKDKVIQEKTNAVDVLERKIVDLEARLRTLTDVENRQKVMTDESYQMKAQLEKIVTDLQRELESSNLQLSETRRELEQYQNSEDETRSNLKSQLAEMETVLVEMTEKKDSEILELKSSLEEKTNFYESMLQSKVDEDVKMTERVNDLDALKKDLEKEIDRLRSELFAKENDVQNLCQMVTDERNRLEQVGKILQEREREVADLKQMLTQMQVEIGSFRDFEKQVKELRLMQLQGANSGVSVTPEGEPDLSGWTEHELAELSTKLQSDLDTALYMLHQRDVRCDELTFELMQLIEERDTLQLRLSTALRINEELRTAGRSEGSSSSSLQENKDILDQSNDRQAERLRVPGEDLQVLASKMSQLHSVSYLRDKTVKDDSVQRHAEQMSLLSRVSDSDVALGKDAPSSTTGTWARGKTAPKVMHI